MELPRFGLEGWSATGGRWTHLRRPHLGQALLPGLKDEKSSKDSSSGGSVPKAAGFRGGTQRGDWTVRALMSPVDLLTDDFMAEWLSGEEEGVWGMV